MPPLLSPAPRIALNCERVEYLFSHPPKAIAGDWWWNLIHYSVCIVHQQSTGFIPDVQGREDISPLEMAVECGDGSIEGAIGWSFPHPPSENMMVCIEAIESNGIKLANHEISE